MIEISKPEVPEKKIEPSHVVTEQPGLITSGLLSTLLLEKGPLAIRHITRAINEKVPEFKDLSASKQRRLIMGAMETGDKDHGVLFEKVGWGQWAAKKVDDMTTFDKELESIRIANLKVRDNLKEESANARRKSSTHSATNKPMVRKPESNKSKIKSPLATGSDVATSQPPPPIPPLYIDEEVLASDEDEYEEENNPMFNFKDRRTSTVVYADSSPEAVEQGIVAKTIRPLLSSNRMRRSSSKTNSKKSPFLAKHDKPPLGKVDLDLLLPNSGVLSEPTSRRRSRSSFSKESGIRSTLFAGPTDTSSSLTKPTVLFKQPNKNIQTIESFSPQTAEEKDTGRQTPSDTTEEEDWAAIGADNLLTLKDQHHLATTKRTTPEDETHGARLLMNLMK
ncbi:hypothetical protein NCAS_0C03060 [Naumovozyma castellii]|uniref:Protein STB3 n=1 Tax=Naumovozyma castellii TaxID=27288 RepID=G0VCT6_NAUCA|nr:hypothetical protein NCAS_0C03060 [Naumovozyma castellii CBS 4309]CCC69296.1 hypothetical protein NCAS_0C03060 [Naumovozyma castellii CBS 4309]